MPVPALSEEMQLLLHVPFPNFRGWLQVLEAEGFGSLESTYRRYWLHEGQRLLLRDSTTASASVGPLLSFWLSPFDFQDARSVNS
jgi:hypothetical protein